MAEKRIWYALGAVAAWGTMAPVVKALGLAFPCPVI